jgi:hypothetical protein
MEKINNTTAQAVFRSLCSFRNSKTGLCCPSIDKISRLCALSKRSTRRSLKYLCDNNVLKINRKNGGENFYSILSLNGYKDKKDKIDTHAKNDMCTPAKLAVPPAKFDSSIICINNINNNITSSLAPPFKNKIVATWKNKILEEEEDFFLFYTGILEEYNKILSCKLRTVDLEPTTPRVEAIKNCMKSLDSLPKWKKFFNQILNTSFLCGSGKKNFKADLDWIIDDKHFIKIREGRYETNEEKAAILKIELMEMVDEKKAAGYDFDESVLKDDYKPSWEI